MPYIIVIVFLLFFSCKSSKENSSSSDPVRHSVSLHPANVQLHASKFNLKGPVKRVEQKVYIASGVKDSVTIDEIDEYEMNRDVYPLEFNEKQLVTLSHSYASRKRVIEQRKNFYDSRHRISKTEIYRKNTLHSTITCRYKGNSEAKEVCITASGDTLYYMDLWYEIRKDTMYLRYQRGGNSGRSSGESERLTNGILLWENLRVQDSNLRQSVEFKQFLTADKVDSSVEMNSVLGIKRIYRAKYNAHGDKIREIEDRKKNKVTTWSYLYDEHENWIEKTTFVNDSVQAVSKRIITYFE